MTTEELFKQREQLTGKARAATQELAKLKGDEATAKQAEVTQHFSAIDALDKQIEAAEKLAKIQAINEERRETMHRKVENGGDAKFRAEHTLPDPTPDDTPKVTMAQRERRAELWSRYHRGERLHESELVTMRQKFPEEAWFSHFIREGETQRVKDMKFAFTPDEAKSGAGTDLSPTNSTKSQSNVVPVVVFNEVFGKMVAIGPMLEICRNIVTETGRQISLPTHDKTSKKATVRAEGAAPGAAAETIGKRDLPTYRYAPSDIILTEEFLQDAGIDIEGYLTNMMSESFARGLNEDLTTGSGSSKPQGVYTKIATVTANHRTTAANTGPTLDEVLGMFEKIDPAYDNSLTFMVAPVLKHKLRQFKTTGGDYLWTTNLQAGSPDMFYGATVRTTSELSAAAGGKAAVLGDFSNYIYRVARNMTVVRLTEIYAPADAIGLHASMRAGGVTVVDEAFQTMAIKS